MLSSYKSDPGSGLYLKKIDSEHTLENTNIDDNQCHYVHDNSQQRASGESLRHHISKNNDRQLDPVVEASFQ